MTETQSPFIERLRDPNEKDKPFEYARELTRLKVAGDFEGMRVVYDAYLVGIRLAAPDFEYRVANERARDNLLMTAKLADLVAVSGCEDHGQLSAVAVGAVDPEGPITQFYREAIGFPKEKAEGETQ